MDFITDLPIVEHLGRSYNYIYTVVDRLIKFVQIIPCFMGDDDLTATDVAQLFFTYIVKLFGVPKSFIHDRDPKLTLQF